MTNFQKRLIKKYKSFANYLYTSNTTNFNRFINWLWNFIKLKQNERYFNSTFLPKYAQGQIILVDFGCGIGNEFSYPHYAIVISANDRKKNSVLTVVPLTSKKEKHNKLYPWQYELIQPISSLLSEKALESFNIMSPEYHELQQKAIGLAISEGLSEEKLQARYAQLIEEGVEPIYENTKDVMMLAEKMKKGSIVLTNHIKTLDKARIITPTKSSQPLYDVKINPHDLIAIQSKIIRDFLPPEVDKLLK